MQVFSRRIGIGVVVASFAALALSATGIARSTTLPARKGITYAHTEAGLALALDLYLPDSPRPAPLVVYIHGGAWNAGTRAQYPQFIVDAGFAVASLDFRSTDLAPFPANVHDIKAAIRFLRARAGDLGFRAERIAVIGASSGGHLATLIGVTNGDVELEGIEGEELSTSSQVQAIVSFFGASNLSTILAQSTPAGLAVREPALARLLGGSVTQLPELARQASPVFHVDSGDPPLLWLHGDQDAQMPINQMYEIQWAYAQAGLEVETFVLHGVGHEGAPFFRGAPASRVIDFLRRTIGR